jgi:phage I-like protein
MRCHYKSEKDAWEFVAMRMRNEYEAALTVKTEHIAALKGLIQQLREEIASLSVLHTVHAGRPEEQATVTATNKPATAWVTTGVMPDRK